MTDTITIWHNPRCSKSRQTLALLEARGYAPKIRLYLETPPSQADIRDALDRLGIGPHALVRTNEREYNDLALAPDTPPADLIAAMAAHPRLIERPIVFTPKGAAISRPPEAVLALL